MKFQNNSNRIIIANYFFSGGGCLVLSQLCATLRELGYDAKILIEEYPIYGKRRGFGDLILRYIKYWISLLILHTKMFPIIFRKHLKTSITVKGVKIKFLPFFNRKNTIVIYPETIWGNPLRAKKIVRWLLFHHRYYNEKNTYNDDDCFIAFRKIFNDPELNPLNRYVTINHFNKDLYRQYNFEEREGKCYIIRKGKNRLDLPSNFEGPVFDDDMSDEEFVRILNKCKYCISYDTQTFYNTIAAVCGCIPIVIIEPGKTVEDYLTADEKHYGIAWGDTDEQIEYAVATRDKLLKSLNFEESNINNCKILVNIIETTFGPIRKL